MASVISSYSQLQTLVASQQLELINVIGLPRANGTALHLALTQAKEVHGQLNEPFFYPDLKGRKWDYIPPAQNPIRTFEQGCAHILKRFETIKKEQPTGKITLVVHDLSPDLTEQEFKNLVKINSHLIFVIRDTFKQALSMLTRYVNDKLSEPGGNKLKAGEVLDLMGDPAKFKENVCKLGNKISSKLIYHLLGKDEATCKLQDADFLAARTKALDIFKEEFSVSWENIHRFFQVMQKEFQSHPQSIFDARGLFDNPKSHLSSLCQRIKTITYCDEMLNKWTKGIGAQFHCVITQNWGTLAQTNAWNGPARNSTGIVVQKDSMENNPISIEQFPAETKALISACDKLYKEMIK